MHTLFGLMDSLRSSLQRSFVLIVNQTLDQILLLALRGQVALLELVFKHVGLERLNRTRIQGFI